MPASAATFPHWANIACPSSNTSAVLLIETYSYLSFQKPREQLHFLHSKVAMRDWVRSYTMAKYEKGVSYPII